MHLCKNRVSFIQRKYLTAGKTASPSGVIKGDKMKCKELLKLLNDPRFKDMTVESFVEVINRIKAKYDK